MSLLRRLVTYNVTWNFADMVDPENYDVGADRSEAPLDEADPSDFFSEAEANVASSQLREYHMVAKAPSDLDFLREAKDLLEPERHVVALDLDIPAYLVPSHTEGHSHLYIDVPGGVAHDDYMELLGLLGRIGVIEPGYAEVSRVRGHTDLRLPWVAKEARLERPTPRCCRCLREATEISEYLMAAWGEPGTPRPTDEEIEDWVWANEGTLNKSSGLFACTSCYIAMGQPSGPNGWTPPGPDSIQPL